MEVERGEIFLADLSPVVGSEQGGVRPVLVVQNDVGNKYSPTVIVVAITSKVFKTKIPTHVEFSAHNFGLIKESLILCEQMRTIDKRRLKLKLGKVDSAVLDKINVAIKISLSINWFFIFAIDKTVH